MAADNSSTVPTVPWWRLLNKYQWFVFVLAAFGWMFDCFDQQIFTMSRFITMRTAASRSAVWHWSFFVSLSFTDLTL